MSQMTAVAMLLPAGGFPSRFGHRGHQHHDTWQRCLVACHHSRGTRAVSNRERFSYSGKRQGEMFGTLRGGRLRPIRPVGHERKPVEVEPGMSTVTCQNATCGPPTHAHGIEVSGHHARAPSMPPHSLPTLAPVNVLYSAITTLIVVLWWKDVTHMQVRAWVHQQGLAGVMKLKSASKCFEPRGIFSFLRSLMKHASFVMQNLGTDVRTVMASLAGTQELSEAMETRMRAVGVQLEETRRELEEAERRRVAEMMEMRGQMEERERELAALKGEFAEQKDALMDLDVDLHIIRSVGDQRTAWEWIKLDSRTTGLRLANLRGLPDAVFIHVSRMTHLTSILLDSISGFTAEGIQHLYRLPRLQYLDLSGTAVSDGALEGIGSLTSIDFLDLRRTKVTDSGLSHLTGLSSLEQLVLAECKGVTNAGMGHVGRLTRLESLVLRRTAVTDDGLSHLTGLSSLEHLGLSECKGVTNAGMVHVGKLIGLESLELQGTAVTDAGLQQLTALTKLTFLQPPEGGQLENDAARRRIVM